MAPIHMKPQQHEYDPDRLVFEAVQAGDADAMGDLMRANQRWIRGVIFGVLGRLDEVDDVLQRVWLRIWREARRVEESQRWRQWIYRVARNAAMDTMRGRRRRRRWLGKPVNPDLWLPKVAADGSPERQVLLSEQNAIMLEAISALPELYREPFILKHLQDMSYRQIGELLNLPNDTVETRLVRARRLLREKLTEQD